MAAMRLRLAALFVLALAGLRVHAQAAPPSLESQLRTIAAAHAGKVALFAENLQTHQTVSLDPDLPVQTASVIKLGILYEALEQIRTGKVHFEDRLAVNAPDQVPGSGILHLLDAPMTLTFKDALTLMIVMSDNEATNLAIDHLGLENIDRRMASLGLANTYLYKKIFTPVAPGTVLPADQKRFGLGKSTPHETVDLLGRLIRCELAPAGQPALPGDPALCQAAANMLHLQFYRGSIPRYLEGLPGADNTSIANKTGALEAVRNDAAAISTPNGMILMAIFTFDNTDRSWVVEQPAEFTIAKLARAIVTAWSPAGLAPWPAQP